MLTQQTPLLRVCSPNCHILTQLVIQTLERTLSDLKTWHKMTKKVIKKLSSGISAMLAVRSSHPAIIYR